MFGSRTLSIRLGTGLAGPVRHTAQRPSAMPQTQTQPRAGTGMPPGRPSAALMRAFSTGVKNDAADSNSVASFRVSDQGSEPVKDPVVTHPCTGVENSGVGVAKNIDVLLTLKDGMQARACTLTEADRELVEKFYLGMSLDTLSDAHGTYCALRIGLFGDTHESATDDMLNRFDESISNNCSIIGMKTYEGGAEKLIGIAFYVSKDGGKICESFGITVTDKYKGKGVASRLKGIQIADARAKGFEKMISYVDPASSSKPTISILRKEAANAGLDFHIEKVPKHQWMPKYLTNKVTLDLKAAKNTE